MSRHTIPPERLRWKPKPESIGEDSTRDIAILDGTIGEETARQALRFAVLSPSSQQHVFVRGRHGSRRRKLVESVFNNLRPQPRQCRDFCFVHNFANPDRPRLITLPGGRGRHFQQHMHRIGLFVKERLPEILENEPIRGRRESRKVSAEREISSLLRPFERTLDNEGLGLIRSESGPASRLEIGVKVMGKPVTREEFRNMVARKQASDEDRRRINDKIDQHQEDLQNIIRQIRQIWQQTQLHIEQINHAEAARLLGEMSSEVSRQFRAEGIKAYLRDLIEDVLEKRVGHDTRHLADPTVLYSVKVLRHDTRPKHAPVIAPNLISAGNLFGSVDPAWRSGERAVASFRGIHAGALIEADGGFLVLDADDLVGEPQLFRRLLRSLRTGSVEILAPTPDWYQAAQSLKPEPVPIDCRVILIGDDHSFQRLGEINDEFREQFRVLADLDPYIDRNDQGVKALGQLVATIVREETLLPLDRAGISAAIEYCARQASQPGRIAIDPGRLAAVIREASFIAGENDTREVGREAVEKAIQHSRQRAGLSYQRFFDAEQLTREGILARGKADRSNAMMCIETAGITFGLPTAISTSTVPSSTPTVQLDGGHDTSGLRPAPLLSLLATVIRLDALPPLEVTIAFSHIHDPSDLEATTLAQLCTLIAKLAGVPLRQDLALVGNVDVHGHLLAVDNVNERIEGYFDTCAASSLSGQQGVIIPRQCVDQLILEQRVISGCANDTFRVNAVDTVAQALELATGERAGTWKDDQFPDDSILGRARRALVDLAG